MPEWLRRAVRALTPGRGMCWLWLQPDGAIELASLAADPQAASAMPWADWCAAHPGARCHLLVSSPLLSVMTVAPGLLLKTLDDVAGHARAQFVHYHGSAAQSWPVLPWQAGAASGATALSGADIDTLRASADPHGVQLLSLQPAWSALLPAQVSGAGSPEQTLLILDEGVMLTAVACNHGKPAQVQQRRCDPSGGNELIRELIQELQLPPAVTVQHLRVPTGLAQCRWQPPAPHRQFMQPPRHSPMAWVAAVCSCLLAAVTGADALDAWQQSQAARAAVDATSQPVRNDSGVAGERAARPSEAQAALLTSLATPWPTAFAAAEASSVPGVRWLGLELDGRQLRLEGTTGALANAWQAASALARQPGVSDAALSRVQSDAGLVHFELRAAWSPSAMAAAPTVPAR